MLLIVGTVPDRDFPLTVGRALPDGDALRVDGRRVEVNRGTPALAGAAVRACSLFGMDPPIACLAGDTGLGHGSRLIYRHLFDHLGGIVSGEGDVLVFHYLQPEVDGHSMVMAAVEGLASNPLLVADAGFMYAAKMAGAADRYDLFTPDAGGNCPFWPTKRLPTHSTPGAFSWTMGTTPRSGSNGPTPMETRPRHLLVKGARDLVASRDGVLHTVAEPSIEALEAIGGTGDTVTGMAAALMAHGLPVPEAARVAAQANRLAAWEATPTPATSIAEIVSHIGRGLEMALEAPR